jgi:type I restriction enzyme S subunit
MEKQFSRLEEAVANLKRVKASLKRYKASVLKAAVEGKLTEEWRKQHPDVEPASELLKRILAERRAKWEETEITKMKVKGTMPKDDKWKAKYPKPTMPNPSTLPQLPDQWCWTSIDALLEDPDRLSYGILKPGKFLSDGVPMVRIVDIGDGVVHLDSIVRVSEESAAGYDRTKLEPGDIMLAVMATIGRAAIVPEELSGANVNRALAVLKLSNRLLPPYALHVILSPYFQNVFSKSKIGSAQARINLRDLRAFAFPLAPHQEQKEIAGEIEKYLSIINQTNDVVDKNETRADRLKQAILGAAFSGKLVEPLPTDEPAGILLERIKAQRKTSAVPAKLLPREGVITMEGGAVKVKAERALSEVLRESDGPLTPEELLTKAGYTVTRIDRFYEALKYEVDVAKTIKEVRPNDTDVLLELVSR